MKREEAPKIIEKVVEVKPWLPPRWDYEADVVVAGAGGAGLVASKKAADAGADVILLEKMPVVGGSTIICMGGFAFAGTDLQKRQGIEDSSDRLYEDLMKVGRYKNTPEVVRAYVDNQLETYHFLKEVGVKFDEKIRVCEPGTAREHLTNTAQMVKLLKEANEKKGVKIMLETKGVELIAGPEKEVLGIKAKSKEGKTLYFKAKRAIVLSTGGFGRNPELLDEVRPGISKVISLTGRGTTGDGLIMGRALGAATKDMAFLKASFAIAAKGTTSADLCFNYWLGAAIVNKEGKRFVNESIGHKEIPEFVQKQTDGIGILVFDEKIAEISRKTGFEYLNPRTERYCLKADTIEELAAKVGMPPTTLRETIDKYNSYVETGQDPEFGRTTLCGTAGKPIKIDTPPFYALEAKSVIVGTYCGLKINKNAQVIDVYGKFVPRFYAAGEVTGGFHGDGYMGGSAVGKAVVLAYIAGKNAAAEKPWE